MVAANGLREKVRAKKDMAARARRLAFNQVNDEDRQRLLQFANDLEAEVEALERGAGPLVLRTGPVTREQQQVQQQQQAHEPSERPKARD